MFLSPKESGEHIFSNAKHVQIHPDGIAQCSEEIVRRLKSGEISLEAIYKKTELHPQKADKEAVDWVFFTSTLNFSFWNGDDEPKYHVTYKGKKYTGYLSLCAAVDRALDDGIPITSPKFYGNVSLEKLDELLMGDDGVPCPLIKERHTCLQEVSSTLEEKFGGTFFSCLTQADHNAQKLIEIVLEHFKCYRDRAEFAGKNVSILKRAQILVSDVWALFEGKDFGRFEDIDSLSMFADYRVPQSLQYFGVFTYTPHLIDRIQSGILENGSELEVEIRGCSIAAVERIVAKVKELLKIENLDFPFLNSPLVDYFLWGFRREKAEEMEKFPYHKTRSVYY